MPGPNQFQVRRTSVADREANTLTLPNAGELALNILDGRLFSTNGATIFEVGANTKNCRVSNSFFVGNSVVNVFANSTIIQVSNSTVNTHLAVPTSGQYSATNYFLHANGSWVQVTGGGGSTRVYQSYTATGGQTTYTVSGGYTVGQIEVFENGVHLANTEYTQNGSTVVLTTGSLAGAIIEVSGWIALSSFTPVAAGSDTWVQFNDATAIGGSAGFTFNKASNNIFVANTVTVGGPINANGGIGSSGDVLKSNGTGSYWGTVSGGSVGGANTNVLFNDSTAANGVSGFTFDKDTNTAVVANTLAVGTTWTANSTLVNANAINCRNQVNTATLFAATTIDVGANVNLSTTQLFVGNSITNTTLGNNYIDIGNTVVNTFANSTILRVANSSANVQVTPNDVTRLGVSIVPFGQHTIFVPAYAMYAANTNGAASGQIETGNAVVIKTFDFDTTTPEFTQFAIQMPKSWNEGTIVAQFLWSHPSTSTNFGVAWSIEATAFADGDVLNTAFTGTVTTTDTGGTTDDIYISAESAAVTVAGSPTAEEYVIFRITRATGNASDNMAVDARLHGVRIHYTTDAAKDD